MDNNLKRIINQEYYDNTDIDYILSLRPNFFKETLYNNNYFNEVYTILTILSKTDKLTSEWLDTLISMLIHYNKKDNLNEDNSLIRLSNLLSRECPLLTDYFLNKKDMLSLSKYIKNTKSIKKEYIIDYILSNYSNKEIIFLLNHIEENMILSIIDKLAINKRVSLLFLIGTHIDNRYKEYVWMAIFKTDNFNYIYILLEMNYLYDKEMLKRKLLYLIRERKYENKDIKKVYLFLNKYYNISLYEFLDNTVYIGYFLSSISYTKRLEYLVYLLENKDKSNNKVRLDIYGDLLKRKDIDLKDIKLQEDIKLYDDTYKHYLDSMNTESNIERKLIK